MSGPKIEVYTVEDKRLAKAAQAQAKMRDELRGSDERLRRAKLKAQEYNQLAIGSIDVSSISENTVIRMREEIARVMEATEPTGISASEVEERLQLIKTEIMEYVKSQEMTTAHKTQMRTFPVDIENIKNSAESPEEKSRRIKELYKDFYSISKSINSDMELMYAAYVEYLDEFIGSNEEPKAITSFEKVEEIEEAKKLAKEINREKLARDYVMEQINDVMAKHGFNVVQSDSLEKANGRQLFAMDEDSALDVFVSNNNQLSMRVVGIGFNSEISEDEDEELLQKQISFCTQHPQIMRDLERRGVKLKTVVHREPSKKYNVKIPAKTDIARSSSNRAKKELKRQDVKTLHKE